jgi:hypothetical protein
VPIISDTDQSAQAPILPQTVAPTPPQDQQSPGAAAVIGAAFRQQNIVGSLWSRDSTEYAAQPGYDPYANNAAEIQGYDAKYFVNSQSPAETQQIKNRVDQENTDKRTIANAGVAGWATSLAAGATDPILLASMFVPGLGEAAGASRLARIGGLVATNVAAGEVQSAALASTQETTNYTDGIIPRIGTNALLAGVLGHIATRVPRPELDALAERTSQSLQPVSSTAGAAAVPTTTLADESIARGGQGIAKTVGQISPVTRIMTNSEVPEARQLAQQLVDPGGALLNKNFQGIATPTSVEMRVNQAENARNVQLIQKFDQEYTTYKTDGGELSQHEFSAEVADAMRNGDTHEIPQVQKVAQFTRPMFDGDRKILNELGVMGEGDKVVGAPSYFPRVYDMPMVLNRQTDLELRLRDWFTNNPKLDEKGVPADRSPPEVTDAVRDTINNIMGMPKGATDLGSVKNPSVLKARSLDVPDSILKPYLSSDFEHVTTSYNHTVLPQLEMRRTFGSTDLTKELQGVSDAYKIKQNYATSDDVKARLSKQEHADLADLTLLRDRALNQTGARNNEALGWVRAAEGFRAYNVGRSLGGQLFSALPDWGRIVGRYGLWNTSRRTASFILNSDFRNLSKADSLRFGTAVDNILHTRMHSLDGVGDGLAGSKLGVWMHNQTARFMKYSGILGWDSAMRNLSAQLEQDALHRLVYKGNISTLERAKLAAHGVGDAEIPAIREQWQKYGSNEQGLNRARTELWDNKDAAARVEQAVQRAASSNAFFVGKGDLPATVFGIAPANSQVGKALLQFKGFAMSSVNRLAIPLAQGIAHGDAKAANGLAIMLALGGLRYYLKERAAGREPDMSPKNLGMEMVLGSGVLTFLPDLWAPVGSMLHLPIGSKFKDHDPLETAMGPTFGEVALLIKTITQMSKGNISAADIHKLRQLLPYQNLFYLTRLVNMLEGKTEDFFNVKHAPGKSAADYFNPSQDVSPKNHPDKEHLFNNPDIPNAF